MDEEVQGIGRTVTSGTRGTIEGVKVTRAILKLLDECRHKAWQETMQGKIQSSKPFTLIGNESDLAYFYYQNELPKHTIDEMSPQLQKSMYEWLGEAEQSGFVRQTGYQTWVLTPQGKEHISTDNFVQYVRRQQQLAWNNAEKSGAERNALNVTEKTFEINGNERDLWLLADGDIVNLNDVLATCNNEELAVKSMKLFEKLAELDVIKLDSEGNAQITDMGRYILKQEEFLKEFGNSDGLFGVQQSTLGSDTYIPNTNQEKAQNILNELKRFKTQNGAEGVVGEATKVGATSGRSATVVVKSAVSKTSLALGVAQALSQTNSLSRE